MSLQKTTEDFKNSDGCTSSPLLEVQFCYCVSKSSCKKEWKCKKYDSYNRSAPKNKEGMVINTNCTRLYFGLLRYVIRCFQRHVLNCSHPFCGKRVEKHSSFEPCVGRLNSLTKSLFFLYKREHISLCFMELCSSPLFVC
ncbi:hypothetical protein Ddye_029271 [Dipteronia dyeriana]|uniref:Uncharacterized protein n=1 Tax=Dipteronia dyeriana TaxID=168575 RepID=A0AAD9TE44_9ROSI|nr:hypothetical protein Ddye_029271 [Dipteronia dyeriana]